MRGRHRLRSELKRANKLSPSTEFSVTVRHKIPRNLITEADIGDAQTIAATA
jgi:hypothetical protein